MESGDTFADRYRLVEALGRGSSGEVWRATDASGKDFVVKRLRSGAGAELEERFARELAVASRLAPPHFPRFVDGTAAAGGVNYIIWEAASGVPLPEFALENAAVATKMNLIGALLSAVLELHSLGIVHRDLKPDHVLVSPAGCAVLLDLGLCRLADMTRLTASRHILGSAPFVAPEQIHAPHLVDERADLYSMGIIAFWLLSGRLPFRAPTVESLLALKLLRDPPHLNELCDPPIPGALADWVQSLLHRDPSRRPPSGQAALARLREILALRHDP